MYDRINSIKSASLERSIGLRFLPSFWLSRCPMVPVSESFHFYFIRRTGKDRPGFFPI